MNYNIRLSKIHAQNRLGEFESYTPSSLLVDFILSYSRKNQRSISTCYKKRTHYWAWSQTIPPPYWAMNQVIRDIRTSDVLWFCDCPCDHKSICESITNISNSICESQVPMAHMGPGLIWALGPFGTGDHLGPRPFWPSGHLGPGRYGLAWLGLLGLGLTGESAAERLTSVKLLLKSVPSFSSCCFT